MGLQRSAGWVRDFGEVPCAQPVGGTSLGGVAVLTPTLIVVGLIMVALGSGGVFLKLGRRGGVFDGPCLISGILFRVASF